MCLESNRAARLVDLERTLLNLFKETDDACSGADVPLIERLIADIKTVASDISITGRTSIQSCLERSDYIQVDALRLRYNPLIGEHSNQVQQRLTDRLYFLTGVPEGRTLIRLKFLENKLLSFISEAEEALCSNDDAFLAGLIDKVNSVADEIVSLAQPLRQTYDHEGKSKEADALKRMLHPLIRDRVDLVINR